MYMPRYHALTDLAQQQAHIDQHPLGSWVCIANTELVANHIPFVLDRSQGPNGRLIGHVSRANPVWRQLGEGAESVVMFMGPQAYITPSWYPGKHSHGKVVPTWNYVTVHAHGVAHAHEDAEWIANMLQSLTRAQESSRPVPWSMDELPPDYLRQKLRAIVGIELVIDRLEGRMKVSQDEDTADRQGTVDGLRREPGTDAHTVATLVELALRAGN